MISASNKRYCNVPHAINVEIGKCLTVSDNVAAICVSKAFKQDYTSDLIWRLKAIEIGITLNNLKNAYIQICQRMHFVMPLLNITRTSRNPFLPYRITSRVSLLEM